MEVIEEAGVMGGCEKTQVRGRAASLHRHHPLLPTLFFSSFFFPSYSTQSSPPLLNDGYLFSGLLVVHDGV